MTWILCDNENTLFIIIYLFLYDFIHLRYTRLIILSYDFFQNESFFYNYASLSRNLNIILKIIDEGISILFSIYIFYNLLLYVSLQFMIIILDNFYIFVYFRFSWITFFKTFFIFFHCFFISMNRFSQLLSFF